MVDIQILPDKISEQHLDCTSTAHVFDTQTFLNAKLEQRLNRAIMACMFDAQTSQDAKNIIMELLNQLENINAENDQLKSRVTQFEADYTKLCKIYENQKQKFVETAHALHEMGEENKSLHEKVSKQCVSRDDEIKRLNARLGCLRYDYDRMYEKLWARQQELQTATFDLGTTKRENESFRDKIEELKKRIGALVRDKYALISRLEQVTSHDGKQSSFDSENSIYNQPVDGQEQRLSSVFLVG